jgi:hypothetical protein
MIGSASGLRSRIYCLKRMSATSFDYYWKSLTTQVQMKRQIGVWNTSYLMRNDRSSKIGRGPRMILTVTIIMLYALFIEPIFPGSQSTYANESGPFPTIRGNGFGKSATRAALRLSDRTNRYQWLFKERPNKNQQREIDTTIFTEFDREVKKARKLYLSGKSEQAVAGYRKAIDYFEAILRDIPPRNPVIAEMDRRISVFEELASKIPVQTDTKQDLAAQIFHLMEERRVCELTLVMKKAGPIVFFDIPEKLVNAEAHLSAQLLKMSGRLSDASLQKEKQSIKERLERVRASLRNSSPRFAFLNRGIPPRLGDVQRHLLGKHEVILDFNLFRDRLVTGVITREKAVYYQFPSNMSQIQTEVFLFQDKLREFTTGERSTFMGHAWKETSRRLWRSLLGRLPPLPEGKKTVFIIPDKALWYLPFSTLLDPEDHPLGLDRLVSIIPSVDLLAFGRTPIQGETRSNSSKDFLIFECLPWISERDIRKMAERDSRGKGTNRRSPRSEKIESLILSSPVYPKRSKIVAAMLDTYRKTLAWTGPRATVSRWLESKEGGRAVTLLAVPLAITDLLRNSRLPSFFFSPDDHHGERRYQVHRLFSRRLGSDLLVMPTAWYDVSAGETPRGEGPLLLSTAIIYSGVRMALINYSSPNWGANAPLLMKVMDDMAKGYSPGKAVAQYPRDLPGGLDSSFSGRPPEWAGWILMGDPGR